MMKKIHIPCPLNVGNTLKARDATGCLYGRASCASIRRDILEKNGKINIIFHLQVQLSYDVTQWTAERED